MALSQRGADATQQVAAKRLHLGLVLLALLVACKENPSAGPSPLQWGDFRWGTPSTEVRQVLLERGYQFVRTESDDTGAVSRFVLSEKIGLHPSRIAMDFVHDRLRRVAIVVAITPASEMHEFYKEARDAHIRQYGTPLSDEELGRSHCADKAPPLTCWQDEGGTTLTLRALPFAGNVSIEYEGPDVGRRDST